jgi:hypothetical protein
VPEVKPIQMVGTWRARGAGQAKPRCAIARRQG